MYRHSNKFNAKISAYKIPFTKKKKQKQKQNKVCIQHIGTYFTHPFILSINSNVRNVHNGRRQKMLHSYKWIEIYLNLYSSSSIHTNISSVVEF